MSGRMLRVNSIIKEILADEVERLSDARLEMVSITGVDTAPDLRRAKVYIDVLGLDQQEQALAALERASKRLQRAIGREARIKYTPILEFVVDPAVVAGERIESILRSLRPDEEETDD